MSWQLRAARFVSTAFAKLEVTQQLLCWVFVPTALEGADCVLATPCRDIGFSSLCEAGSVSALAALSIVSSALEGAERVSALVVPRQCSNSWKLDVSQHLQC